MKLLDTLRDTPVLIVTGTGGVGKTTTSCAISIGLAQKFNAKVLVITIDPAKRLSSVLSEETLSHEPKKIAYQKFIDSSSENGELYAAMVDTSQGWNKIVNRFAKSEKDAQRIFSNNLFSNLTTRFSHSHDFVAMDSLYEHYRSGEFDYIVLDTPPTSKAFGFFDAPQAMSEFFGGKLVKLITSPYRFGNGRAAKLFDIASQPFFAITDKVLGKEFLNDIGEFFFLFHTMYDDFVERATSITKFLKSKKVNSVLIVDSEQFILKSYKQMSYGLEDRDIHLSGIIINKVPFLLDVDTEIVEYINAIDSKSNTNLDEILKSDLEISKDINTDVKNYLGASFGPGNGRFIPVALLSRMVEIEITDRLTSLVSAVDRLELLDNKN